MSQNQLIRRLKREATRNPKKFGALGLLLVVALWFWVPLVWGWFHKDEPAPSAAGSPTAVAAVPGISTPNPFIGNKAGKPAGTTYSWDQVAEWMEKDPLTKAAATLPARRNPFRASPEIVASESPRNDNQRNSSTRPRR